MLEEVDVANQRTKITSKVTPYRAVARNWRTSSARRAGKLGRVLENIPSIDAVENALLNAAKVCLYCRTPVDLTKRRRLNLDHRLPISRGGNADLSNMVISCGACNRAKGECTAEEFEQLRATVAQWADGGKNLFIRLRLGFFR